MMRKAYREKNPADRVSRAKACRDITLLLGLELLSRACCQRSSSRHCLIDR